MRLLPITRCNQCEHCRIPASEPICTHPAREEHKKLTDLYDIPEDCPLEKVPETIPDVPMQPDDTPAPRGGWPYSGIKETTND